VRSKAQVFSHLIARNMISNSTEGMDVLPLCLSCVVHVAASEMS
jgi:hypothetical protein